MSSKGSPNAMFKHTKTHLISKTHEMNGKSVGNEFSNKGSLNKSSALVYARERVLSHLTPPYTPLLTPILHPKRLSDFIIGEGFSRFVVT